jgi:hypothetical protein
VFLMSCLAAQPYPKAVAGLVIFMLASLATALAAPITLELSAGSVIKGDLVSWNGQQAVVRAEFGSTTFKRDQLNLAEPSHFFAF